MRPASRSLPATAMLVALTATLAPAQDGAAAVPAAGAPSTAVGLALRDGRLVGGGPRYAVEFDDRSIAYTHAFGAAAPRTLPWRFALEAVGRGAATEPVG